VHAFASFEWADLITPDARKSPIALISIPCEFPFASGAPDRARTLVLVFGSSSQTASPDQVPRLQQLFRRSNSSCWCGAKGRGCEIYAASESLLAQNSVFCPNRQAVIPSRPTKPTDQSVFR